MSRFQYDTVVLVLLTCSYELIFVEASSSKHYGTSDTAAATNGQEDESSASQPEAKDDDSSRVGAARAAAFILISCRPSTSESPTASPGRAKRAKKLGNFRVRNPCALDFKRICALNLTSTILTYYINV